MGSEATSKQTRYSNSRDGHHHKKVYDNSYQQASKYTNLKEEKAKVSKILEELEKKAQIERELKIQLA